ncbi:MAG: UDP-N-acetylmuramate:L-alanyl-gamma-D-glutamyl-meso-diaminopimelate ligase, partial [Gammaproteobacteria bacterium]
MRLHILGICGTFMGGVAAIAKSAGHHVSGSDENVYPPMSTQLRKLGIRLQEGYESVEYGDDIDCVIVGNVLSRGNPAVERLLNSEIPYYSGPQWLANNVLQEKWVLAVAGTHGKTTTTSMLAWILECAGLEPGFLIGGVPNNFGISARLSDSRYFVVEADEYDTAFFDKRAKFVHYRPRTLAITNIEYDHADIYPDLDSILWQFHQLIRTVPGEGLIACKADDENTAKLFERGVWTPRESFSASDAQ